MNTEQAIKYFEDEVRFCERAPAGNPVHKTSDWVRALEANKAALEALVEKQERKALQPMTKEELQSLVGQWGWVVVNYKSGENPFQCDGWALVPTPAVVAYLDQMISIDFYGEKFIAYRDKPKRAKSNADRIRAMSDEELAVELGVKQCPEAGSWRLCNEDCESCWLEWLRHPVEEAKANAGAD